MNKKAIGWGVIVAIVLALLILVLLIGFSEVLKEKIIDTLSNLGRDLFGR